MNNARIAWRNLWRNKRRTLITSASVFFGVIFATVMSSMQEGSYSRMIDNMVQFYSGYIQIHQEDYWENKTINNTFILSDSLETAVENIPEITTTTTRLESYALASSENLTKGAVVIGIDPVTENVVTGLKKRVVSGRYLQKGDRGVLVGKDLANYLQLKEGDTLVLLGLGYHGVSAAGKFPVTGILDFPFPEFNRQFVYMTLPAAQDFYSADSLITSMVLMIKDQYQLPKTQRALRKVVHAPYGFMSWDEMQPALVQMIASDRGGGKIMKDILYMIIAFGVLGTVMMMISERKRESGVMVAIGMQKSKLSSILFIETLYMGFLGVLAGVLGSLPIIAYYFQHPIRMSGAAAESIIQMGLEPYFYFSWMPKVFYNQAITILILTFFIAFYPFFKSRNLRVSKALRA